ncbi:MAG: phosphatase PAP2 family protein [Saprospiraceae bacterium]|nr:phosphatase PAP2 family protein [Saprospiraceae bacterium]
MNDNIVLRWNTALLQAVRATSGKPPVVARHVAMVHTAIYDAWAHYDKVATGVYTRIRRVPAPQHLEKNITRAVSYAAYRVLCDLFPGQTALFDGLMCTLGYNTQVSGRYDEQNPAQAADLTPEQIGNTVAFNLLVSRRQDNSNQAGNYEPLDKDYQPVNAPQPARVKDINHWQPLLLDKKTGAVQQFLYPHWGWVTPFVFKPGRDLNEVQLPVKYPREQVIRPDEDEDTLTNAEKLQAKTFEINCQNILDLSRGLNDSTKAIAEYWADGPGSETPPGHWCLLARNVSLRDCMDTADNVKMFFALGNALLDAGIACWRLKVENDYCRPVSAIHTLFEGNEKVFWGGPYLGNVCQPAETWRSYLATPPFAEFPSGHSTFSSAAASILRLYTGSNFFGMETTVPAGSSKVEPGLTPSSDITLEWQGFSDAAEQAGYSRLVGGIHFSNANEEGQKLGNKLAALVWGKVQQYWNGVIVADNDDSDC